MKHMQPEQMQRFLADELDLMEREAVAGHLAHCEACAALLVQLTADDDSLSQALRLDDEESAWIATLDLTQPVLAKIRPWYREPAALAIIVPLITFSAYMLAQVGRLVSLARGDEGPIGFTVEALRSLVPALWKLNVYLGQGGLLRTLWPVLLGAAAVWFWRSRTKKEEKRNA